MKKHKKVRSASARPDGTLIVKYKDGSIFRQGKWAYLKDTPLTERELQHWN